nr:hypothetical protein [uncultured Treponema sp.]
MQKLCLSRIMEIGFSIAVIIFISSCMSRSTQHDARAFGIIGTEADAYIFSPVSGNESLLLTILTHFVSEQTVLQYLNRTSALYIGVNYEETPSITVVSSGSYPVSLGYLLFSKKDGWEKHRAVALNNHTYYNSSVADVVLQEKNAFALFGGTQRNTAAFLQRIAEPHQPVFPPRFQVLGEAGRTDTIGLYTRSGNRVAAALLGLDGIELPIRSIELYLKKNSDSIYRCFAVLEATDTRTALVVRLLLSRVMDGDFSVQDASVFVENADITEIELIKMLEHIIFKSL